MRKILISIILLANISKIFGQNNSGNQSQFNPSKTNVPTSPEVALLGRFGDIPVGHYTGTASVSVPLYNLKVDNIEIPLALNYHTSGIKVADEATWVGLGWSFMPEGTITQEIRGKEDNPYGGDGFSNNSGYNAFKNNFATLNSETPSYRLQQGRQETNDGLSSILPQPNDDAYDVIIDLKAKKGQPDIFTYNFYGYSGKFFYNPEDVNEILFIESNEDVKFVRNFDGWLATTNKGDKFFFYVVEKSRTDQTDYTDIGITFKISKITLTTGKTINFTYQDEKTYQLYPAQVARFPSFHLSQSEQVTTSNNATINDKKTLVSIETEDTKIDFNLANREDIKPNSSAVPIKKLASIDIKSKFPNKMIKSFVFNTDYFPTIQIQTVEEGYRHKRLKLNSVQEINYNSSGVAIQNTPPYLFEYDLSYVMPSKISSSDFYGYNNGNNSLSLLPDLNYFDYLNTNPYKNYNMNVTYPYSPTSRYVNQSYVPTNILKKITYPTKARTEFEYESNTFNNQFIPTRSQVDAIRRSESITHRGASTVPGGYYFLVSQVFKPSQTVTIKFKNTIFDGYMGSVYPQTHYPYSEMVKCKIKLYKRKASQPEVLLKEWKIDVAGSVFEQTHQQQWNEDYVLPFDSDPTTEYYVYVENGIQYNANDGIHFAVVSCDFEYNDDGAIDKSVSYGHGVRIKSIKNYENNTLLSHKAYNYSDGKLIYKFEPIGVVRASTYKSQPTMQDGGCFMEYQISIFNELSVNSNDFGTGGNKPFGYSEVTETDINIFDGTTKGSTKYGFSNEDYLSFIYSYKGLPKRDITTNGEGLYVEKYDQNQNKVFKTNYFYSNLPNTYAVYPQFYIVNTSTGPYDPTYTTYPALLLGCGSGGNWEVGISYTGATVINQDPVSKYHFIFNPLITGKRRLMKTTDISYFGNKTLIKETEFTYTNSGEVATSKATTSDGEIIETDYDYAADVNNTRLVNKGMTGIPLSIETYKGTVNSNILISHVETKYDNLQNYLPSSVMSRNFSINNMETEVTYDRYDSKGNLLQYTMKGGIPVSLIWGYNNTKVIAMVEGIDYDGTTGLVDFSNIILESTSDVDSSSESNFINTLDNFRKSNYRYPITTYTYDPLIGVTSITPPSGIREVYKYDAANRLEKIVDINGKVLKEFKYNYKP
ncbi:RHS repeat domain-containing protein [Chryseobacterium binzhouense]|uniref:hypothetical protein n=1 Tax=Chryseobacterium binzhouense TaxID=2593646 RepID=UPI00117C96A3|nr:hypothetical protein [Chryseobacterium binzhouense]MXS72653.1 hypothetical protein [Flavobacteriaceae bacterium W22]